MRVAIVMPAYNAARTLERTYRELPEPLKANVILGDNRSTDGTAELAERLGITVLRHERNYGYGGNLKRLYRYAVAHGADFVVELHPNYQYEPGLVDIMVEYARRGYFDVLCGNRMRREDGRAIPTFITQALTGEPLTVFGDGRQTRSLC